MHLHLVFKVSSTCTIYIYIYIHTTVLSNFIGLSFLSHWLPLCKRSSICMHEQVSEHAEQRIEEKEIVSILNLPHLFSLYIFFFYFLSHREENLAISLCWLRLFRRKIFFLFFSIWYDKIMKISRLNQSKTFLINYKTFFNFSKIVSFIFLNPKLFFSCWNLSWPPKSTTANRWILQ